MKKIFKSKTTYLIIFLLFSFCFLGPEKVLGFVFGSESNVVQWIRENTIIRLRTETDDVRMGASNTLFVDTSENKLGVGTDAPSSTLSVIGNSFVSGVSTTTAQYISGDLYLQNTGLETTNGVIYKGTSAFLHNFQHPTGGTVIPVGKNTFIGINAGNFTTGSTATDSTQGSYNTGIGDETLNDVTTGNYNTIVGAKSGEKLTTASLTTIVGSNSGGKITTARYNTIVGGSSMLQVTTGAEFNSAVGVSALGSLTSGDENVAIGGINTLNKLTTGSKNTAIGTGAGYTRTETSNGVFIGYKAGYYETADNALIIDGLLRADEASGRTDSLIYGVMNSTPANQILSLGGGGKVGIGTTTPAYTLDVLGTINSSSTTTAKVVGVGLSQTGTTPQQAIDVSGNINITQVVQPVDTITLTGTTGGALDDGAVYKYSIVYVTANGDTSCSGDGGGGTNGKSITLAAGQNAVLIENIPVSVDPRVTGRRIYRSIGGGNVATGGSILINNNTDTSYTDLIADESLDANFGTMYRKDNLTVKGLYVNNILMAKLGIWNMGIGSDIFAHLTTGIENFAFGKEALHNVSSGSLNIAVGSNALISVSTGVNNIGVGYAAGSYQTTGRDNVSIGVNSGRLDSTVLGAVSYNVGVGSGALNGYRTGDNYNVGIGFYSGAGFRGSHNIFIGQYTGKLPVAATTTAIGSYNILIGDNTGDNAAAGADNNILIGKQLDLQVANGDNQLSIGNLIFGTGLNGTGTTVSTGNIGVGTTTPTAILHLKSGTATANTAPLKFTSGTLLGTPEDGAMEYDGTNFYLTIGSTRRTITTSVGGSANKASCWKADGSLGYCSDAVGADGSCTCN